MYRKIAGCMMLIIICLLLSSCTKLPETENMVLSGVKMESAKFEGGIPKAWGNLISVSHVSQLPAWLQLWFQDKDGNIYMLWYNSTSNVFLGKYRYLKRK